MSFLSSPRSLFFTGLALTITTGWFSMGYHHPDEHYQILEFAKYKLGEAPAEDLPWEFHEEMRPGLQPFLASCLIRFTRFFGIEDPFIQIAIMRMLAGVLAFCLYWKWCDTLAPTLRNNGRLLRLCLVFFWMFAYINVRFSSENMSAIAFFGGLLLIYPSPRARAPLYLIGAGFLMCLSFFFRYQIAFAGVGLVAWLFFKDKLPLKGWLYLLLGAIIGLLPGIATDYWLYDNWVFAPYNYFAQNIVEDKAATFGVSPWWWYFTEMPVFFLPPISLFLFWFMGVGIRRYPWHVFVWLLVPFVIGHSMVAHKETRFMFPMVFPMFYLAVLGWDYFSQKSELPKWLRGVFRFCIVVNVIALLFRCFYPANEMLSYYRFMRSYAAENPGTTIYWEKVGKKKKETLTPHFYQTPWMKIEVLDSLPEMNNRAMYHPKSGDLIYFRTSKPDFVPEGFQTERAYRWFPDWLLRFNVNNWVERTRIWSVYRLK